MPSEILFARQTQGKMKDAAVNDICKPSLQSNRVDMYNNKLILDCKYVAVHTCIFQQATNHLKVPDARNLTCGSLYTE